MRALVLCAMTFALQATAVAAEKPSNPWEEAFPDSASLENGGKWVAEKGFEAWVASNLLTKEATGSTLKKFSGSDKFVEKYQEIVHKRLTSRPAKVTIIGVTGVAGAIGWGPGVYRSFKSFGTRDPGYKPVTGPIGPIQR